MIRTPPQHNTINPPGQIVNPINQEKTLAIEIDRYKSMTEFEQGYLRGYREGWNNGLRNRPDLAPHDLGSEAAR